MLTLVARLCALCAISALLEMTLGASRLKGAIRAIYGLLMIEAVIAQLVDLGAMLADQHDLKGFFHVLMK